MKFILSTVLGCLLFITCCSDNSNENEQVSSSRIGHIEFENDYPTEETAIKLREELKFQAAV